MATKPKVGQIKPSQPRFELLDASPDQFEAVRFYDDAPAAPAPEEEGRTLGGTLKDVGISALKGAIAVPEAAVGLADLVTGGYAGKLLENEGGAVGFRPKQAKAALDEGYSAPQKAAFARVQAAEGLGDTFMAAVQNPSVIGHSVVESLPLMGAGGVLARGGLAAASGVAPRLAAAPGAGIVAGAVGEGTVGAGSAAESIRQQTADGTLTGGQAGLALASGGATALFGYLGGKVAQKLGIADVDTMLAGAATNPALRKGVVRSALEGAFAEGVLEELPQSISEQVLQNIALDRPLDEGVNQAAVLGLLSGGLMGGGANVVNSFTAPEASGLPEPAVKPPAVPAPNGPLSRAANLAAVANLRQVQEEEAGMPNVPQTSPPDGRAILQQREEQARIQREAELAAQRAVESPDDEILQSTGAQPIMASAGLPQTASQAEEDAAAQKVIDARRAAQQAQQAQAPAAQPEPAGRFTSAQEAQDYISTQRRRAGSASLPRALPIQNDDGSFGVALDGTPAFAVAAEQDRVRRLQAAGVQPDDVLNPKGEPFKTKARATTAAKKQGGDVVPVTGGFVVRKQQAVTDGAGAGVAPAGAASDGAGRPDAAPGVGSGVPDAVRVGANTRRAKNGGVGQSAELPFGAADAAVTQPAAEKKPEAPQSTDATGKQASWVIREKATGDVVMETFDRKKVEALNTEKFEAVPIAEHLASLNQEQPGAQPVAESQALAPKAGEGAVANAQAGAGPVSEESKWQTLESQWRDAPLENLQQLARQKRTNAAAYRRKDMGDQARESEQFARRVEAIIKERSESQAGAVPDTTKKIDNAKRRLREARNAGDEKKAQDVEREIRALRQQAVQDVYGDKPARETITPAEDKKIGQNDAGQDLYQRKDGSVYRMANGRPDFGGDLSPKTPESDADGDKQRRSVQSARGFTVGDKVRVLPKESADPRRSGEAGYESATITEIEDDAPPAYNGTAVKVALPDAKPDGRGTLWVAYDRLEKIEAQDDTDSKAKPESAEPFTHSGLKVYPTRVKQQDGSIRQQWAVQTAENAEREKRGERQIGGDELVHTREQAVQRAEEMAARAERDAKSRAELEAQERAQADKAAASKAEAEDIDGFMPNATKLVRGRIVKTLSTPITNGGKTTTRKALVRERVAAGAKVEQAKEGRRLVMPSGAYLGEDQISKTAMDYAEHLIAQRSAEPAAKSPADKWAAMSREQRGKMLDAAFGAGQTDAAERYASRDWDKFNIGQQASLAAMMNAPADQPAQATHQDPGEKPQPAAKPTRAQKAAAVADARAKHFTPGNVVNGYGGSDEVIAYDAPKEPGGAWSVTVHRVVLKDGKFLRAGKPQDARTHSTEPDQRELERGPLVVLPYTAGAEVAYTEPRADGKPFENAPDRGSKPQAAQEPGAADIGWDTMSPEQRTQILSAPGGWSTAKGGLNAVGKGLAKRAWADIVPATRATIEGLVAKVGSGAAQPASKTPTVDAHEKVMEAVREGTATPEQFKASFEAVVAGKEAIVAELGTKTKAELIRDGGYMIRMRYANESKPDIVDAFYRELVGEYVLGETLSYGMGKGAYEAAVRRHVEATDADKLAQYAKDRAAAVAEAQAKREARVAALENPKTLDDFRNLMNVHIRTGKSRKEAFLMLTPEQRVQYDELEAESTREARERRKRELKTQVRAAGQTTGGEIIATKHTRDGYDLYVVQLADRVSKEDYQTLLSSAKRMGGWYSSFRGNGAVPGFQFKDRAQAEAFKALAGGDTAAAQEQVAARRDAFEDDRSQSAVERLTAMADKLDEQAQQALNVERKTNTARRARFASAADDAARQQQALAKTMRNIAQAIEAGRAKFLDSVRTKTQVEMLARAVHTAKDTELRAKYDSYGEQQKRKGQPPTAETADYAEFPSFTAFRSDLASLARQMLEVEGTKKMGAQLMKVADDVTDAYMEFAKANQLQVSQFGNKAGGLANFSSREDAERAIKRSGLVGKAIVLPVKRGENRVILSPSEAMSRGIWTGDGDKRITLTREFGQELVDAIGRRGNKSNGLSVPWQFESASDRLKAMARIGIETPAEFRSALREFIGVQEQAKEADRVKMLERDMVGRKNDGLDFFPTPQTVADQMVEAAGIEPDMAVLEPSAGMGHIADRIREAGAEPDVIEMANDRAELLEAKGFNVMARDFMEIKPRESYTFGDVFKTADGIEGIMRGAGGMGSNRVRLVNEAGDMLGYYDRDELTGVRLRGTESGYDRIIMNPPFSDRRDAEHVRHAFELLRPGGRLVAIMGEGVFFGKDKKAQDFRDWLEEKGGTAEKLPEGSFMDPTLPVNTAVNARMVVIDKPGAKAEKGDDAPMFSRSASDPAESLADTLLELGRVQELFQLPKSDAKDLVQVAAAKNVKAAPVTKKQMLDNRAVAAQTLGMNMSDKPGAKFWLLRTAEGKLGTLTEIDGEVYIDVSVGGTGLGGSAIYDTAMNYTANNPGKVFIGDPNDLSKAAMSRRLENMLSAAVKYGGTDFMRPHQYQTEGRYGFAPLDWTEGDSRANIEAMVKVSVAATGKTNPVATANVEFDPATQSFRDWQDQPLDAASLSEMLGFDGREQGSGSAGRTTLQRNALYRALLSGPGARRALLESVRGQQAGGGSGIGSALERAFYSRGSVAPASLTRESTQQIADAISARWANAPEIIVARDMSDYVIPQRVRDSNDAAKSAGASGEPEGFIYQGKVYLVSDQLRSSQDVARVLFHEALGHAGLRGVFGDELKPILRQIALVRAKDVRAKAKEYGLDMAKEADRLQAAEEVLANMAQTAPELGFVKRAIAAIRTWLRNNVALFRDIDVTDDEIIRDYILPARGFIERGREASAPRALPVFSRKIPELGIVDEATEALVQEYGEPVASIMDAERRHAAGERIFAMHEMEESLSEITSVRQIKGWAPDQLIALPPQDDPAYSRAAVSNLANRATDLLNDALSHPGKLSFWDKSVGSMYHIAQRYPAFRRVFNAAQNFINDVSFYATEAAEQAPKILPRLETWRDLAKSPIKAADNTAISRPILEGTLSWTRDEDGKPVRTEQIEGAGIVWSAAELRSMFNLTDEQIALYREFRAATDLSLDNMGKADLLRYAGKDLADLRDMVMDAPDVVAAAKVMRGQLQELADADPERRTELISMAGDLEKRAEKVAELKARGYAPLSRFGRYSVDVVVKGERKYFSLFDSARDSNKMAAKMRAEFGDDAVSQGTLSQREFEAFQGITPESLELFGNMLDLDSTGDEAQDKVFQTYLKLTKANRSAMKRLIHRKGVTGYSDDMGRVLAAFVYSNARQTSAALHMGEMGQAVQEIPNGQGELKDVAIELSSYIKQPREEAQALRGLLFAQYLGGSVASAFVNFTQPFTVTFPYLIRFGGARRSAQALMKAMADQRDGVKLEEGLSRALKTAEEQGVVAPQEVHQLMAQARGESTLKAGDGTRAGEALAATRNAWTRTTLAWGKLFGMAEQINRRSTFIAAYRIAAERGMRNPAAFATKAVNETQFVNNRANKARWARGPVRATLMTFKSYSVHYMELMHRLATREGPEGKKAAAMMLGMLLLVAGAGGLPFVEDAEDVVDMIAQRMGYNFSTKQAKQKFLEDLFGKAGAEFVDKGITGLAGSPIDISGRMSMANLIPGTGLLLKKPNQSRDMQELVGPVGDLVKRGWKGADLALSGEFGKALLEVSPRAVANAAKGVDMANTGVYTDTRGRKVIETDLGDAAAKFIGFQPQSVARVQDATFTVQKMVSQNKMREAEIAEKWAQGIYEGNKAKIEEARAAMRDWNRKNPKTPIRIELPQILKRVRAMRMSKEDRIAKTAPSEIRGVVQRELAAQ